MLIEQSSEYRLQRHWNSWDELLWSAAIQIYILKLKSLLACVQTGGLRCLRDPTAPVWHIEWTRDAANGLYQYQTGCKAGVLYFCRSITLINSSARYATQLKQDCLSVRWCIFSYAVMTLTLVPWPRYTTMSPWPTYSEDIGRGLQR